MDPCSRAERALHVITKMKQQVLGERLLCA